jgi:hypothetical protein
MKNIFFLILIATISSCTISNKIKQHKTYKAFVADKNRLWHKDTLSNLFVVSKEFGTFSQDGIYLMNKYKEYLMQQDTTFVLKQFGQPNSKFPKRYIYYTTQKCFDGDYLSGCVYYVFNFDSSSHLSSIIFAQPRTN